MGNTRPKIEIGSKFLKSEKGAALVWVALLMPILIGFCALVIDIGRVALEKHRLQNAIDAACLAGAKELPNTDAATLQANKYIDLNGYNHVTDVSSLTFPNGGYTIKITSSKTVSNTFAEVLGFTPITVHPIAAATRERGPFDYAVFSGSKNNNLGLSNNMEVEGGMVHTNNKIQFNGSTYTIPYGCESMNGSVGNSSFTGTTLTQCEYVDIDRFHLLSLVAATATVIDHPASTTDTTDPNWTYSNPKNIWTWNYDGRAINGGIYVKGDLTIKSADIVGKKGVIVADGNINFIGSDAEASVEGGSSVCIYSVNGDIITNGGGSYFCGTVYAPKGQITFNGGVTVYGRVIADKINFNGSAGTGGLDKIKIISNPSDLSGLPPLPPLPYKLTQ